MYNCYMYAAGYIYIFKSVFVFISLHVYMYSYMMYNLLDLNLCTRVPGIQILFLVNYCGYMSTVVCVHLFSCRGSRHSSVAEREHRAFQYFFFTALLAVLPIYIQIIRLLAFVYFYMYSPTMIYSTCGILNYHTVCQYCTSQNWRVF